MTVYQKGDMVEVNMAPFVASPVPSKNTIPAEVLDTSANKNAKGCPARYWMSAYGTRPPLWVDARWIVGPVKD